MGKGPLWCQAQIAEGESSGAGPSFFSKVSQENWTLRRVFWTGSTPSLVAAVALPAEQPYETQFPTGASQEDFAARACPEKDGVANTEGNF